MPATSPITSFIGKHSFLSNFYPARVEFDRQTFPSVEHAYQAAKTLVPIERRIFHTGISAGQAKRAGRRVTLRADWIDVKLPIMLDLLRKKFWDDDLAQQLLATQDAELVEGNHWGDTFWGVCRGEGANHLGRLLMQVRQEIGAPETT